MYKYILAIPIGALLADSVALRETAEALHIAEQPATTSRWCRLNSPGAWCWFTTTVFSARASTFSHKPVTLRSSTGSP